jgi:hypothetical protein
MASSSLVLNAGITDSSVCAIETASRNDAARNERFMMLQSTNELPDEDGHWSRCFSLQVFQCSSNRILAEGVGFEPTVPLQARRFSRPVP